MPISRDPSKHQSDPASQKINPPVSHASPPIPPVHDSSDTPLPLKVSSASPPPSAANAPTVGDRVAEFFEQLSAAAVDLNAASDELGRPVAQLDAALKKLNLGITTWVRIAERRFDDDTFEIHKLGYAKINAKWGIALKILKGENATPSVAEFEEWLFAEAPRALRIEAVDHLPELLQELVFDAKTSSQKIREKVEYANRVAVAINKAATDAAARK